MQSNIPSLIEQTKTILQTREYFRQNYEARLAPSFVPIEYFVPEEPELSRALAKLLDPRESHAQGTLFLDAFVNLLKAYPDSIPFDTEQEKDLTVRVNIPDMSERTAVYVEHPLHGGSDRLDILLIDDATGGLIAIENKPWACDGKDQLARYARWVREENKDKTALVVFLCDRAPSECSIKKDSELRRSVIRVGFGDLARCLKEVAAHAQAPAVRYFVESLSLYLLKNVAGEQTMTDETLLNLLAKPDNLAAVKEIYESYPSLLTRAWERLCKTLAKQCSDKSLPNNFNGKLLFEYDSGARIESRYLNFRFRLANLPRVWSVAFECDAVYLGRFFWGVRLDNADEIAKGAALRSDLKDHFDKLGFGIGRSSHGWPWWQWGKENVSVSTAAASDIPLDLKDPQWLALMLEGKENVLTKAIWDRVEAVFPPNQPDKWPKF